MAVDHISIDQTKRLGARLRRLVDKQRGELDEMIALKAIMDECVDGTDYTEIAVRFGIGSTTAEGQAVYNLLTGALAAINVFATQTLLARCG